MVLTALCGLVGAVCENARPLPFSSTMDGPIYFLPLIKAQTDAVLAGQMPRMFWELGSGWSPVDSGQTGLLYLPYYLSNLIARWLGRPLALLEVNAWLHLWGAGLVAYRWLPAQLQGGDRLTLAALAMFQPAAFLIGLNWHNYLASYPWFLAAVLLVLRQKDVCERWNRRSEFALALVCGGLFVAAHPQMYSVGVVLLGGFVLATVPRRGWFAALRSLAVAQLPMLLPLVFLKLASMNATRDWMAPRADPGFVLQGGQSFATVLRATLTGNLLGGGPFNMWPGISDTSLGLFFNPLLFLALGLALWHRKWAWGALLGLILMVMSIRTFPELRHGPLSSLGFRWTWKLALFCGPLTIAGVAVGARSVIPSARSRLAALVAILVLSITVCLRGLEFDLWPAFEAAHPLGVERVAFETRSALERAGVLPGSRVALVGRHALSASGLPLPILGITGNAPLLAGYESAHLYEPMESAENSRGHLDLTTPWRMAIDSARYSQNRQGWNAALQSIGVHALVSATPGILDSQRAQAVTDALGRVTYIELLNGTATPTYPWAVSSNDEWTALQRIGGGRVLSAAAHVEPPSAVTPRPLNWQQRRDGRWEGTPILMDDTWWMGELGLLFLTAALVMLGRRTVALPIESEETFAQDEAA